MYVCLYIFIYKNLNKLKHLKIIIILILLNPCTSFFIIHLTIYIYYLFFLISNFVDIDIILIFQLILLYIELFRDLDRSVDSWIDFYFIFILLYQSFIYIVLVDFIVNIYHILLNLLNWFSSIFYYILSLNKIPKWYLQGMTRA